MFWFWWAGDRWFAHLSAWGSSVLSDLKDWTFSVDSDCSFCPKITLCNMVSIAWSCAERKPTLWSLQNPEDSVWNDLQAEYWRTEVNDPELLLKDVQVRWAGRGYWHQSRFSQLLDQETLTLEIIVCVVSGHYTVTQKKTGSCQQVHVCLDVTSERQANVTTPERCFTHFQQESTFLKDTLFT